MDSHQEFVQDILLTWMTERSLGYFRSSADSVVTNYSRLAIHPCTRNFVFAQPVQVVETSSPWPCINFVNCHLIHKMISFSAYEVSPRALFVISHLLK